MWNKNGTLPGKAQQLVILETQSAALQFTFCT
jgi:hypothetical protein